MMKLCIFVGTTVGGLGLGWLGDAIGLSFMWSFLLSGAGSVLGVYVGWKLGQRFT